MLLLQLNILVQKCFFVTFEISNSVYNYFFKKKHGRNLTDALSYRHGSTASGTAANSLCLIDKAPTRRPTRSVRHLDIIILGDCLLW